MNRVLTCLGLCTFLLVASCCCPPKAGLVGTWKAAEDDAQRGPIAAVSFCPDHTFTAGADYDGQTRATSGCWCYCKKTKKLMLCTGDHTRSYDVSVASCGSMMTVSHDGKDYHMVRMKPRGKSCGKPCSTPCDKPCSKPCEK